jgi:CheY-like chemotaxis protein
MLLVSNIAQLHRELHTDVANLKLHILIVDDVMSCRKMLCRFLSTENVTTEEAKNGHDAIMKVNESIARGHPFDSIFMDSSMPVMSGPVAVSHLRANGFSGKIYGVTGNALPEDVDDFLMRGVDAVKIKPVTKHVLLDMLRGMWLRICSYFIYTSIM